MTARISRRLRRPQRTAATVRRVLPTIPTGRRCPPPFKPKVIVWRERQSGRWLWTIGHREREQPDFIQPIYPVGTAPTQPAALALGLAALDTTRSHR